MMKIPNFREQSFPLITTKHAVIFFASLILSSCGGGGGGGGGGGRTTGTGLRLIHGAIAIAPLEVLVSDEENGLIQKAAFAEETEIVRAEQGPINIRLQRANSPGAIFRNINATLAGETEYSIFVYGDSEAGTDNVALLPEPVEQPETGFARVQLLNALGGASNLQLAGSGVTGSARFGGSSGFFIVPFGAQTFSITDSGFPVSSVNVNVADRGEATIVVSGSQSLGAVFTRVYQDLD